MSENRDIGTGIRDEGKSLKGSGTQQEEEEKAKQVSEEGKSSSSTPTEISVASELGDTSRPRRAGKEEVQDKDEHIDKRHDPLLTPPTIDPSTQFDVFGYFLFDIRLTPMDVQQKGQSTLFIPVEMGLGHFPFLPDLGHQSNYKEKVKISSTSWKDRIWSITITYDPGKCAFLLNSSEWHRFSKCHHLKAKDVICFFMVAPLSCAPSEIHYLIKCIRRDENITSRLVPEFREENFLFQEELSYLEERLGKLYVRKEDLRNHFCAVGIPAETHMMERLHFTDAKRKDWCVKIRFYKDTYTLEEGWNAFLMVHKAVEGDVIRFYKPVQPINVKSLDGRYFLIQHLKRKKKAAGRTSNDTRQPGTTGEIKDGNGGDKRKGGSSGGRNSHAGGGKGKKSGVGHCRMARKW